MNIQCYNVYHIYNISSLLISYNVFGLLRHTVHEDTSAKNKKMFRTLHMFIFVHLFI